MKNERRRTRELESLSAYLDGELDSADSQALEGRLQVDPVLQLRLEELRKTKRMVGYLPRLHAPHNYTLTPEMVAVRRQKPNPFMGPLRLASALAALLLVVLFGVEFLFTSGPLARPQLSAKPMMEAAMDSDEAGPEPLILWGVPGAGGYGSDDPSVGYGGGTGMVEEPIRVESLPVEEEIAAEGEALTEEAPAFELGFEALPPAEEDPELLQMAPADEKGLAILGINQAQSGEIIGRSADNITAPVPTPAWRVAVRALQITLAAIAAAGGLAWWLLKRRGSVAKQF
jgi:hypothetical protein